MRVGERCDGGVSSGQHYTRAATSVHESGRIIIFIRCIIREIVENGQHLYDLHNKIVSDTRAGSMVPSSLLLWCFVFVSIFQRIEAYTICY